MERYDDICLAADDIYLPAAGVDMNKWAVVACDQYTSQPEYWRETASIVGDAPSTLRMIYPEAFLGEEDGDQRCYGRIPIGGRNRARGTRVYTC